MEKGNQYICTGQYDRTYIVYEVRHKNYSRVIQDIYKFIIENNYQEQKGIIYCNTHEECIQVYEKLSLDKYELRVGYYDSISSYI